MLVPAARFDEAKAIAKQVAEAFTVGDPLGEGAKLGPLVSRAQRDRVVGLIDRAVEEGAELVTGGSEAPIVNGQQRGWFVKPTVFATTDSKSTIAQEEVFGPVLTILPYADEDEAVAHRQRHAVRARRRGVGRGGRTRSASRAASAPDRSTSTAARSTRARRSAATSSRATVARAASTASRSSSNTSRCS